MSFMLRGFPGNAPVAGFMRGGSRNTTYIQNNFFGAGYGGGCNYNSCFTYRNNFYGNFNTGCNCGCSGGGNKWMNWMMGFGLATTFIGGILNMFGINTNMNSEMLFDGDKSNKKRVDNNDSAASGRKRTDEADNKRRADEANGSNPTSEVDDDDLIDNDDDDGVSNVDDANNDDSVNNDKKDEKTDTLSIKTQETKTTTNYPVKYGDTWCNVIMGKYKDENGNPISYDAAKELWTQLKEECGVSKNADGMPPNIELPNNFKNYTLDINGKVTENKEFKKADEPYKAYDGKGFTPGSTTSYTATGTVNGKSIGTISGNYAEVTAQLVEKGFTADEITSAIKNGEIKVAQKQEE